jgi:hypothetical protein
MRLEDAGIMGAGHETLHQRCAWGVNGKTWSSGEKFFFDAADMEEDNAEGIMQTIFSVYPPARVATRLSQLTHDWVGRQGLTGPRNELEHPAGVSVYCWYES